MKRSNPIIPEGINAQPDAGRDLAEFVRLVLALGLIVALAGFLLFNAGRLLGGLIPFSWEQALASEQPASQFGDAGDAAVTRRLQELADQLTEARPLPEGMSVTLHYIDTDLVNAFAGLGGHIYIFRGLLEQLETENAVAALLGHEIGHVAGRHVVKNLSGAVLVQFAFAAVFGNSAELSRLGGEILHLEILAFSRNMERQADSFALTSQEELYGHFGGYLELFTILGQVADKDGSEVMGFLQTHPRSESRIEQARILAREKGLVVAGDSIAWSLPDPDPDEGPDGDPDPDPDSATATPD